MQDRLSRILPNVFKGNFEFDVTSFRYLRGCTKNSLLVGPLTPALYRRCDDLGFSIKCLIPSPSEIKALSDIYLSSKVREFRDAPFSGSGAKMFFESFSWTEEDYCREIYINSESSLPGLTRKALSCWANITLRVLRKSAHPSVEYFVHSMRSVSRVASPLDALEEMLGSMEEWEVENEI